MSKDKKDQFYDGVIALMDKLEMSTEQSIQPIVSILLGMLDAVTKEPSVRRLLVDQVYETLTRKLVTEGGRPN